MLRRIAPCLLILALAAPGAAATGLRLRYAPPAGAAFVLDHQRDIRNERTFMGNHMVTTATLRSRDTLRVRGAGGGGLDLEIDYGERGLEVDGAATRPFFAPLAGRSGRFRLTEAGEVADPRGLEDLPVIRIPAIGDHYGAQRYRQELRGYFPRLPDAPAEPGDRWTRRESWREEEGGAAVDVVMDYEYRLAGPDPGGDPALLAIDCIYRVRTRGQIDAGGLLLDLDLSGEGRQRWLFDTAAGMVRSGEGTLRVAGRAVNEELAVAAPLQSDHDFTLRVLPAAD